jgi:hypothetical protein
MDIITPSVIIRGTQKAAGAIILALCDHGTPEAPRTPSEAEKWAAIRRVRGELLAASDYTMLADAPPYSQEQVDCIAAYRQQLRDIPQNSQTPESVVFPSWPL